MAVLKPSPGTWGAGGPAERTAPAGHQANHLLGALEPPDYQELAPHLHVVELDRGASLVKAGEEVAHVWFPHDCVVSLVSLLACGATAETGTIGCEGMVGFVSALGDSLPVVHGVVRIAGTASRMERGRFRAAFEARPAVRRLCLRYAGALIAQVLQSVACNAHHSVEARLARSLLMLQDRVDGGWLPLTHDFLAQMLGANRTSVTLAAQVLQRAGLIAQRRGVIEIRDRAGLEAASCECYAIVRGQFERLLPAAFG
jgi:CRP-like cAMP-binding protein